jgi:superfamily II DNA or RNA helicase
MTGAGKSFPSMYALDRLRYDEEDAKKAVVVQSRLTKQQWEEYFEEFAPRLKDEVEVVTYHSIDKLEGEYILIVYDEAHKLPADTFSKGATIPTKYRIGATASPYREDGRQNYVFALTGPPVGLDWKKTAELMERTYHEVNVHIVDDPEDKVERIQSILGQVGEKRTLIFSDSLDFGEKIADATGLSFVNGEDGENQLDRIHDALDEDGRVIVSRIGDHGFSRDDLEVVLEADFLYGSRRQQLQRTGRLFHGEGQRHDIFFTRGEFNKYQKRLYSLIEKGFDLNFVDQEEEIEVPEKYESRVDLDVDVESSKVESMTESNSSTAVPEDMDNIDFLKNDQIQEVIEDAMDGYSRVSDEDMWDTLLAIADSDDGMTHDDIEKLFEKSKSGSRYTKPFREGDSAILVSNRVNGQKRWDLNVESFKQIIEKHEQRKQKKERISELKQDIGI